MSQAILRELDRAALRQELPAHGLIAGDIGTVVFVHADGNTPAVQTLLAEQVEPVSGAYIPHARKHAAI